MGGKDVRERVRANIDGKEISLFRNGRDGVPTVYANMYADVGEEVLDQCDLLGCGPFHLVTVTKLRWEQELSPWACGPVISREDSFTGEADGYVRLLEDRIVPFVEGELRSPTYRVIAGYSMGGLFAIYAPYVTRLFSASVSASGSVWFPEMLPFVRAHDFMKKPDAVYLSIGDRESRGKNPYLSMAESRGRELYSIYGGMGIDSVFELNPGNHYKDAEYRLARGITWILKRHGKEAIPPAGA